MLRLSVNTLMSLSWQPTAAGPVVTSCVQPRKLRQGVADLPAAVGWMVAPRRCVHDLIPRTRECDYIWEKALEMRWS